MTVSVIIPTLGKRPEMLKEAIESIENQTVKALEIIVVNDGDTTFGNQARKINKGVKESKGEAYCFMGDDDILLPNFIEVLSTEMERGNWDMVASWFQNFGDDTSSHGPNGFPLCSTLVSRWMYNRTEGYDPKAGPGCDSEFYFQCFEKGARWNKLPDILYKSRVHKDQHSQKVDWSAYKPYLHEKYNGKYDHA